MVTTLRLSTPARSASKSNQARRTFLLAWILVIGFRVLLLCNIHIMSIANKRARGEETDEIDDISLEDTAALIAQVRSVVSGAIDAGI